MQTFEEISKVSLFSIVMKESEFAMSANFIIREYSLIVFS